MDSVNGFEKNLHNALNKSGRHFSPSPPVVFRLVIESTFPRIAGAFGRGFQNKGQAAFCFGVVGSGHTCKVSTPQLRHLRFSKLLVVLLDHYLV